MDVGSIASRFRSLAGEEAGPLDVSSTWEAFCELGLEVVDDAGPGGEDRLLFEVARTRDPDSERSVVQAGFSRQITLSDPEGEYLGMRHLTCTFWLDPEAIVVEPLQLWADAGPDAAAWRRRVEEMPAFGELVRASLLRSFWSAGEI
jgi:hypothetical protein